MRKILALFALAVAATAFGQEATVFVNGVPQYSTAASFNLGLKILEGGTSPQYYSIFQGGDQAATLTYTLPTAHSLGWLKNGGTGTLSWALPPGPTLIVAAASSRLANLADYTCDGTNDEVQILAAATALAATGGVVQLTEGTFYLGGATTNVVVPGNNIVFKGSGWGTILKLADAVTGAGDHSLFYMTGKSGVVIRDMALSLNKARPTIAGTHEGVYITLSNDIDLDNLFISEGPSKTYGVLAIASNRVKLRNSYITDCDDDSFEFRNTSGIEITNNSFIGPGAKMEFYASTSPQSNVVMTGNFCHDAPVIPSIQGSTINGFSMTGNIFESDSSGAPGAGEFNFGAINGLQIVGNTIRSASQTYGTWPLITIRETVTGAQVIGNTISTGANAGTSRSYGALLCNAPGCVVSGNTFYLKSDYDYAIATDTATASPIITNNDIVGAAGANVVGISLANATNAIVSNNRLTTTTTGISVAASSAGTRISGNVMGSGVTTGYSIADTTSVAAVQSTGNIIEWLYGGSSKGLLAQDGTLSVANTGSFKTVSGNFQATNSSLSQYGTVYFGQGYGYTSTPFFRAYGANSSSSGSVIGSEFKDTYTQTGTAASTTLVIKRVETSLGSGAQKFFSLFGGTAGTTELGYITHTGQAVFDSSGFKAVTDSNLQVGMIVANSQTTDERVEINPDYEAPSTDHANGVMPVGIYSPTHIGAGAAVAGTEYAYVVSGTAYVAVDEDGGGGTLDVTRAMVCHQSSGNAGYVECEASVVAGEHDSEVGHAATAEADNVIVSLDDGNDTLTLTSDPTWVTGDPVIYWDSGDTTVTGLTDGGVYWIYSESTTTVALSATKGGTKIAISGGTFAAGAYLQRLVKVRPHFR